jgi:hypothetical protein
MSIAIVCYGMVYQHTINTNNIYLLTVLSSNEQGQRPTRPNLSPTSKAKTKAVIPREDKANDKRPKQDEVTKT